MKFAESFDLLFLFISEEFSSQQWMNEILASTLGKILMEI